jgi:SET domain-containing protein
MILFFSFFISNKNMLQYLFSSKSPTLSLIFTISSESLCHDIIALSYSSACAHINLPQSQSLLNN